MLPIRPAIRTSRRHSRDLHLRFSPLLYERLDQFAGENGLGLNSSVRLLVERGLTIDTDGLMTGQELASQLRVLAEVQVDVAGQDAWFGVALVAGAIP